MKASQLRDLTRDYANGKLSREAYEAERTRLIEGVVAGDIALRYRELGPSSAKPERRRRLNGRVVVIALLLSLLLVALVAHFLGGSSPAPITTTAPVADPMVELLETFSASGDWSETSLESLELAWDALTPFQRENARRTPQYRRLRHEASQRLREQEALLAAGEMEALVRAVRLRRFGERMGLELEQ